MKNLNKLVADAQSHNEDAVFELLTMYGWKEEGPWELFLGKYEKLLWYGRFDYRNKESRRFAQLYIRNTKVRHKLKWRNLDFYSIITSFETIEFIQNKVREYYTLEELRHDLIFIFLELLDRYEKKPHIDFSGYLMGYFRYKVYELLQSNVFSYDVLNMPNYEPLEDVLYIDTEYRKVDQDHLIYEDEIDLFWVNGECGPLFKNLTRLDRIILRDFYTNNQTDTEIARNNGYHRNSILNKRHEAIQQLKTNIKREQGN